MARPALENFKTLDERLPFSIDPRALVALQGKKPPEAVRVQRLGPERLQLTHRDAEQRNAGTVVFDIQNPTTGTVAITGYQVVTGDTLEELFERIEQLALA